MLKLALPQLAPVWLSREESLIKVIDTIKTAQSAGAELIVFSEGFVPGYPFWLSGTGGAKFNDEKQKDIFAHYSDQAITICLLYTSPSPRDRQKSRMPSSA